ncbi:MBL fold metallo-hydrolase [Algoriphagus jejuensis]|uniref:MBL fold metallo-hydrolase n=1 Tax=Algoriphagus jejuensis TaxID=419934 RepID=A0ABN1N340_9BACT
MKIKVWGCRGSLPSPGPENYRFGGNTSCYQVTHGDACIILDSGSGIQRLGRFLSSNIKEIHILLTHLHIDHMMGLGFFLPLYDQEVTVHLWGPSSSCESLIDRLRRYFSPPLFPIRLNELPNHPVIHELGNEEFAIGDLRIQSGYICHPGPTLGYRLMTEKSIVTYIPDHEIKLGSCNFPNDPEWTSGFELAKFADLLLHDGSYTKKEYVEKVGWGHCSVEDVLAFATLCQVKRLELIHHEPMHTDDQLEQMLSDAVGGQNLGFEVRMCAEGDEFELE